MALGHFRGWFRREDGLLQHGGRAFAAGAILLELAGDFGMRQHQFTRSRGNDESVRHREREPAPNLPQPRHLLSYDIGELRAQFIEGEGERQVRIDLVRLETGPHRRPHTFELGSKSRVTIVGHLGKVADDGSHRLAQRCLQGQKILGVEEVFASEFLVGIGDQEEHAIVIFEQAAKPDKARSQHLDVSPARAAE